MKSLLTLLVVLAAALASYALFQRAEEEAPAGDIESNQEIPERSHAPTNPIPRADPRLIELNLEIDLGDRPATNLPVELLVPAPEGQEPQFGVDSRTRIQLGLVDRDGVAHGRIPAVENARVEVALPHGLVLEHSGGALSVEETPSTTKRVSFRTGSLALEIEAPHSLPSDGILRLDFAKPGGAPFHRHFLKLPIAGGELAFTMGGWASLKDGRVLLHGIPEGEWIITVYATQEGAPMVRTKLPSLATRLDTKREFEFDCRVNIGSGEEIHLKSGSR